MAGYGRRCLLQQLIIDGEKSTGERSLPPADEHYRTVGAALGVNSSIRFLRPEGSSGRGL